MEQVANQPAYYTQDTGEYRNLAGLNLFLTRKCNLRCTYCFVDKTHANDLSAEVCETALDFIEYCTLHSNRRMHVGYIGGEPLIKWKLFQYVTQRLHAFERSVDIGFTTNGTLLDERKIAFITEQCIRVVLSIDGDIATMEDRLMASGKPSYPYVRRGIEYLLASHVPFSVQLTVTPYNAASFYSNVKHLIDLGATKFIFGFALELPWNDTSAEALASNMVQVFGLYKTIYRNSRDLSFKYINDEVMSYLVTVAGRRCVAEACPMGREIFAIDVDGSIYPCQAFVNYAEWQIGDIYHGFRQPKRTLAASIRNEMMQPCQACQLRDFCRKCPRSNYLVTGNPYRMEGISCFLGRTTYALIEDFVKTMVLENNPRFLSEVGDLLKKWQLSL